MADVDRCVPGPINSETIQWTDPASTVPQERLQAHARPHPQGGLYSRTDTGGIGQAVQLLGLPDPVDPTGGATESNLRISTTGHVYNPGTLRYQRTISAGFGNSITSATTLIDTTLPIDTTGFTAATKWMIEVDVCNAFLDNPSGGNLTVSVPPLEMVIPDAGGSIFHSHGSIIVTEEPETSATMRLRIDNAICRYMTADRDRDHYTGLIRREITVAAGAVSNVPLIVDIIVDSAVTVGFSAGSGELIVNAYQVREGVAF